MYYYKVNKSLGSAKEIKGKRNKWSKAISGTSTFLMGKRVMKNIEEKIDQMATYLAEIMLSQLGFNFIPKVRFAIGGIFRVAVGFPKEEVQDTPFYYYEPLSFIYQEKYYEPTY